LCVTDWEQPANNAFLLVSQFSVTGALYTCRPDLVGFVNGLPLVVIELKKPGAGWEGSVKLAASPRLRQTAKRFARQRPPNHADFLNPAREGIGFPRAKAQRLTVGDIKRAAGQGGRLGGLQAVHEQLEPSIASHDYQPRLGPCASSSRKSSTDSWTAACLPAGRQPRARLRPRALRPMRLGGRIEPDQNAGRPGTGPRVRKQTRGDLCQSPTRTARQQQRAPRAMRLPRLLRRQVVAILAPIHALDRPIRKRRRQRRAGETPLG